MHNTNLTKVFVQRHAPFLTPATEYCIVGINGAECLPAIDPNKELRVGDYCTRRDVQNLCEQVRTYSVSISPAK